MEFKSKVKTVYACFAVSKKSEQTKKTGGRNHKTNKRQNRRKKQRKKETKITILKAKLKQYSTLLLFVVILIMVIVGSSITLSECESGYRKVH